MEDFLREEYKGFCGKAIEFVGLSFIADSFKSYLQARIKNKFDDTEWTDLLVKEAVELTGFSAGNFSEIFENREKINEWRIGELVAECVLEDRFKARFYYNHSRDSKNPCSNLTGADLVGFCDVDNEACFLFGEVKTSSDINTPPKVLYSKSGMVEQLETLRDCKEKRHDLVKWLAGKSKEGMVREEFKKAMCTYIKSDFDKVHLVGVLVRDTNPSDRDIKSRAIALDHNMPDQMSLKLVCLYSKLKMNNNAWVNAMNRGEAFES